MSKMFKFTQHKGSSISPITNKNRTTLKEENLHLTILNINILFRKINFMQSVWIKAFCANWRFTLG